MTEGYPPINTSIAKGIDFLYKHQLRNGDFALYYSGNEDMKTNNL